MPWLLEIQLKERDDEQRFYISDGVVTIGRQDCDITLDDHKLSRHHCTLYLHSDQLSVVDNSSTNGTFVNGIRVEKRELNNTDVMNIGTTRIRIRKEK